MNDAQIQQLVDKRSHLLNEAKASTPHPPDLVLPEEKIIQYLQSFRCCRDNKDFESSGWFREHLWNHGVDILEQGDAIAWRKIGDTEIHELPAEQPKPDVEVLAAQRHEARLRKDWETSDRLRDQIKELGYRIIDYKDGYRLVMC